MPAAKFVAIPYSEHQTDPEVIQSIFDQSGWLRFLWVDRCKITLDSVDTIGIGSGPISIGTEETLFFQPIIKLPIVDRLFFGREVEKFPCRQSRVFLR